MAKKKILILLIVVVFVAVAALAVACTDERTIVSVAVTGAWKTDYAVGEAFSPCQLTVTFDNGETMTVDITPDMLSGFDTSSPGTKQVTVTYEGQSVQLTINVSSPATDSELKIGAMPSIFYVGDELSLSGAYVIYNGTERIELTPEMISGFDTSSAGTKTLRISVNGVFITTEITVIERPSGEYTPGTPSVIDRELFLAEVKRVMDAMGLTDEYNQFAPYTDNVDYIIDYVQAAGLTNEEVTELADFILEQGASVVDSVLEATTLDASNYESFADYISAILDLVITRENVAALTELIGWFGEKLEAGDFINIFGQLIKEIYIWYDPDEIVLDYSNLSDILSWNNSTSSQMGREEVEVIMEEAGLSEFFSDYTDNYINEYYYSDEYLAISGMLTTDNAIYIYECGKSLMNTLSTYEPDKMADLALFAKDVAKAVFSGDFEALIAGDSISYKEMVEQINFLGALGNEINGTFAKNPAFVKAVAEIFAVILSENAVPDEDNAFIADMVIIGVMALDGMAFDLLEKITADFVAELYLDFDDYSKADESERDEKFGLLAVKIVNFVAEEYQKLSASQRGAVLNAFREFLGEDADVSIIELIDSWEIKDIAVYSAEELAAEGERIMEALNSLGMGDESGDSVYEYFVEPNVHYIDGYIAKGTTEADIIEDIQVIFYRSHAHGSMSVDSMTLAEFAEEGGAYQIEFDFSKKGFTTLTVSLGSVTHTPADDYNGIGTQLYEGTVVSAEKYVYDETSASDFVYKTSRDINVLLFDRNASLSDIVASYLYYNVSYKHISEDRFVYADDLHGLPVSFEGVDTSREAGVLYGGKASFVHPVYGLYEAPILYRIYDENNKEASTTGMYYEFYSDCDTYTGEYEATVTQNVGELNAEGYLLHYGIYYNYSEPLDVVYEGLDITTPGIQQVRVYVEGYEQYAETVNIYVAEYTGVESLSLPYYATAEYAEGESNFKNGNLSSYYFNVKYRHDHEGTTHTQWSNPEVSSMTEMFAEFDKYGVTYQISGFDTTLPENITDINRVATVEFFYDGTLLYTGNIEYVVRAAA